MQKYHLQIDLLLSTLREDIEPDHPTSSGVYVTIQKAAFQSTRLKTMTG